MFDDGVASAESSCRVISHFPISSIIFYYYNNANAMQCILVCHLPVSLAKPLSTTFHFRAAGVFQYQTQAYWRLDLVKIYE